MKNGRPSIFFLNSLFAILHSRGTQFRISVVAALVAAGSAHAASLSVGDVGMGPGATANVVVSGDIAGESTFGVTILVELVPQAGVTGTVTFTPSPTADVVQAGDPWVGAGTFTAFDTDTTGSVLLNGSVDDDGAFLLAPVTFSGPLTDFPVIASADADGVWDVLLSTSAGDSGWESLATTLVAGTVTVTPGGCVTDPDCADGIGCTDDTCSSGSCVFTPNDANCTDDGLFCNGPEACDPALDCVSTGNPCLAGEFCNETTDTCDECQVDTDCNDGIGCTDDTCVSGSCVFTANDTNCLDDGLFCNGTEVCDLVLDCTSTGNPCLAGEICDEPSDTCIGCTSDVDCDDANVCTDDVCNASLCDYTNNTLSCNDGLFCTATDVCSGGVCTGGGDACSGQLCDEVNDTCVGTVATLTVESLSLSRGSTANLLVSGQIAGLDTFGVNILVEILARTGNTGTVTFTPPPPVDVFQIEDAWPGFGTFTRFDTDSTGSSLLNGSVDDNGTFVPGPVAFSGQLAGLPVIASADAGGGWDVVLSTSAGDSSWEGVATTLNAGTITVAPAVGLSVNSFLMPPGATVDVVVSGNVDGQSTFGLTVLAELVPRAGATGTLTFTPAPSVDVYPIDDPWPTLGLFTAFDVDSTGSSMLNGYVDDNGSFISGVLTFGGDLAGLPVIASLDASGVWDVTLTTSAGVSSWEDLATALVDGAITVVAGACVTDFDCDDGNVCTDDTCNAGVCEYSDNTFSCDDGDVCTINDACGAGACAGTPVDCSILNDVCNAGTCNPTTGICEAIPNNEAGPCDDGDPCTVNGTCVVGLCVETDLDCSALDGTCALGECNPVTGACEISPINEGGTCTDINACTENDTCIDGFCIGALLPDCEPCVVAADCDDGNVCTEDFCHAVGVCFHSNIAGTCDDGNVCTENDACAKGVCVGTPVPGCAPCVVDADCNDGNPCTTDTCAANVCQYSDNDGAMCDDDNICTDNDTCFGGLCAGSPIPGCDSCLTDADCNDGNTCTNDLCHAVGVCIYANNTLSCDDGDPCTAADGCANGACGGTPIADGGSCDDGSICTTGDVCFGGLCDGFTANDGASCDDGDICTQFDVCSGGGCAGSPIDCSGLDDDCNVGVCNPATGACEAMTANEAGPCEDGDLCTISETCATGACVGGLPVDCSILDDVCNNGVCNSATGLCERAPSNEGGVCNDGDDLCTSNDVCTAGTCAGTPIDCSGLDDACNVGVCNAATGVCEALPANEGGSCNDGEACTQNDTCGGGVCAGTPVDCSPFGDACNLSTCNPATGACQIAPTNEGGACDDGDLCTQTDTCTTGVCAGTPVDCSGLTGGCLVGVCNSGTGVCEALPVSDGAACDDGDQCTLDDVCATGVCIAGTPVDCSVLDDICNVGTCIPATGACQATPANEGGSCNDGDPCTINDACSGGTCAGTPTDCSAFTSLCNIGMCNPTTGECGAMPANEGGACDDGYACTIDDSCQNGTCLGTSGAPRAVSLVWQPASQTVYVGDTVRIDLVAQSDTCVVEEVGSLQAILNWAPALLRLDGHSDTGPFVWGFSGFPNDSGLDQLNDPFGGVPGNDGDALYVAFVGFTGRAPAGPGGLVVTTIEFTAQVLTTGGTQVTIPIQAGNFTESFVLGHMGQGSDVDITGSLGAASVTIIECTSDAECTDGNVCTTDTCVVGECMHVDNTLPCFDGLFCTATDTCVGGACIGSGDRCPGQLCNETMNICAECLINTDCDDGNVCTTGTCDFSSGVCSYTNNTEACNDGLFCTATDTCSGGACGGSGDRCPGQQCSEAINACVVCLVDIDCDDGNVCTTDSCVSFTCVYTNNALPCNDGLFCTATDTCAGGTCVGGGDRCPGLQCDESFDACVECLDSSHCDDGNVCTDDVCFVSGICGYPNNTVPCEDGLFCTTGDTCSGGACATGTGDACPGQLCDEAADACVDCFSNADCPDGLACTTDLCIAGACAHIPDDAACDDGLFCTGAEACDPVQGCLSAGDPCGAPTLCDEAGDFCNCAEPAVAAHGPRYLRITPAASTMPVALRVNSAAPRLPCLPKYVSASGRLVDTPVFQTPEQWGTVFVSDRFVEPATAYSVKSDCRAQSDDPENLSSASSASTFLWGDADNTNVVDIDDVLILLGYFGEQAPPYDVLLVDLLGCTPSGIVDIDDLIGLLGAFASEAYPCPPPCP